MKVLLPVLAFLVHLTCSGQYAYTNASFRTDEAYNAKGSRNFFPGLKDRKLYQRNRGMILGLQRGRYTAIELGGEAHWRKLSLLNKSHIIGATANLEYNFGSHVVGYKAGMWMKRGRVNLTYGANVSYYNDFKDGSRFGFGPSVGFRLLGLHLINGYTFLTKDPRSKTADPLDVNSLYMSLRYYFPVENKFVWDRKTMKKKKERKREKAKRKKERQKERESGEKNGLQKLFDFKKDKDKE
ncbi:MAG: hypothetical protein JWQ96_1289 [Segetibacter sp.]|nr:hypothetical protein [Segetibacter sp.]